MINLEPSRILIACLWATKHPYMREIEILFKTLNLFGGKLSNAKKIAYFTEPIEHQYLETLTDLGVKVKIIDDIHNRFVYINKIRILKLAQEEDFDLLLLLDTDLAIVDDFFSLIDETKIGAKQDEIDPLGLERWKNLFEHFNISFPSNRQTSTYTGEQTIPYFNSGVLLIPRQYLSKLSKSWQIFINRLIDGSDKMAEILDNSWYTDQIALTLVLHHSKIPYYSLPMGMNFHTHIGIHKDARNAEPFQIEYRKNVHSIKLFIIHHHHRLTKSGFIRHCYYDNINKEIDKINLSLKNFSYSANSSSNIEHKQNEFSDPEIIVDDLYMEVLQRPADKAGLEHFATLLENKKMHINDIRKALVDSEECKRLNMPDKRNITYENGKEWPKGTDPRNEARTIVDELYMEVLQRPADKAGLEHFATLLENKKMHINDIRKALVDSDEYKSLKSFNQDNSNNKEK